MTDKITNVYVGPRPTNLPPGALIRRWDTALAFGVFVGLATAGMALVLVNQTLPLLGTPPPGGAIGSLPDTYEWIRTALGDLHAEPSSSFAQWARTTPAWHALLRPAFSGVLGLITGGLSARAALVPRSMEILVGGSPVLTGSDATAAARSLTKTLARQDDPAWKSIHPLLRLPRSQWCRHILLYGSSGSGKTTILWPVLRSIVRRNQKAIIYDSKGDFTAGTPEQVAILSPWDDRSVVWDIAHDLQTLSDAQAFAESMIPDSKEPVFSNSARSILVGILAFLQTTKPGHWTWADLAAARRLDAEQLHALMTQYHPDDAAILSPPDGKQAANFVANFLAMSTTIGALGRAWGSSPSRPRWSVRSWLEGSCSRQLILQGNGSERPAHIAALIDCAANQIVSPLLPDSRKRSLFFILDELPTLGKLAGLRPLLDKGRSKGCCCLLGFQDFSQLAESYGQNLPRAIGSMVGTHLIFQVSAGETRDRVAQQIGKLRVASLMTNTSVNAGGTATSTSYQEKERDAILSSDLTDTLGPRSLDAKKHGATWGVRALIITGGKILRLDWPGVSPPKTRPARVPAAWTVALASPATRAEPEEVSTSPRPAVSADEPTPGWRVTHAVAQIAPPENVVDEGSESIAGHAAAHLLPLGGALAVALDLLNHRSPTQTIDQQSELTPED